MPAGPSKPPPLSLGFLGGGLTSAVGLVHLVASQMDRRWVLTAGCFSTDPARNEEAGHAYGVPPERVYSHWRELLRKEQGRLDAIAVLTPTPLHSEMVSALIDAGFPVICEKALATSSGEVQAICQRLSDRNGFLAVTYNYSGYPMIRELRRRIESGALGRVLHFQAEMPQEGFIRLDVHGNRPTPQEWRLSDRQVPMIHLDLGVHLHHLLYYLTGKHPVAVVADQSTYGWFSQIVDNVCCLCRYTDDVQGQIWFSKSALGLRNGLRLRVYGSKGAAEWVQASPEELLLSFSEGRRELLDRAGPVEVADACRYARFKAGHPAGFIEAFANLYVDIADSFGEYRQHGRWSSPEVFEGEVALEGLRFLEALSRSARTRAWQPVQSRTETHAPVTDSASIANLVRRLLERKGRLPENLDASSFDYIEAGYVDSIGLIKFVAEIESALGVEISEADMESPEFRRLGGLVELLTRHVSRAGRA